MTTEVQIRKNRSYLPHIRKIVACIGARLGMAKSDITDTEDAVNTVCVSSIERVGGRSGENLSVRLSSFDNYMTVEITDPCIDFDPVCSSQWLSAATTESDLARVFTLADHVEFVCGDEGTTIRITKYADRLQPLPPLESRHFASASAPANLQA